MSSQEQSAVSLTYEFLNETEWRHNYKGAYIGPPTTRHGKVKRSPQHFQGAKKIEETNDTKELRETHSIKLKQSNSLLP